MNTLSEQISRAAFDTDRAYQNTQALCYPRGVGSQGEQEAAAYLAAEFRARGLDTVSEPFVVSHFLRRIGNPLFFVACLTLVLLGTMLIARAPVLATGCWGLAGLALHSPWRRRSQLGRGWPPRTLSHNIIGRLTDEKAPVRIVFMAHYDTKSQLLPTGVRVTCVMLGTTACLALALLGALSLFGLDVPARAFEVMSASAAICLAALALNCTGNRCPGALDNGSAVGTLLELARCWRPDPAAPAEVIWIATSCEEIGLQGARRLLENYAWWWQERPTLLINLESVGAGPALYLKGETKALVLARLVADSLGFAHRPLHVLGAAMDHEPFADRGLAACSILGDVVRRSLDMHSLRDNMGIIERPALQRAGTLAIGIATAWAQSGGA